MHIREFNALIIQVLIGGTRRYRNVALTSLALTGCLPLQAAAAEPLLAPAATVEEENVASSGHVHIREFDGTEVPEFSGAEGPGGVRRESVPLWDTTGTPSKGHTAASTLTGPQLEATAFDFDGELPAAPLEASVEYVNPDSAAPQWGNPRAPAIRFDHSVPEEEEPLFAKVSEGFLLALEMPVEPLSAVLESLLCTEHDHPETKLDDHAIGIQPVPPRPPLVLEWNDKFLAPGFLEQGIELPTGAIWRPSLWVFGTYRTGVNYFANGNSSTIAEWANRLDLFSQVNFSGTERLLVGLRPLDKEEGPRRDFTGYDFREGHPLDGWNGEIQTLFFEGDFGEIFPRLDPYDRLPLDYGFSVGRQPMLFQQGLLINEDRIDALTITRNTLNGNGVLNLRATAVYAWDEINRPSMSGGNLHANGSQLVGLFTETDLRNSTVNADVAYVWSDRGDGDLIVFGLSGIQRFHGYHNTYNSSLHVLASFPTNGETNLAGQGELLFSQFSWTPHHSDDLIFLNSFWAIDQFTSAARGPLAGGPLGQTGLLFSAAGLGRYGAPLNNQANNVAGASLGYQMFFDHKKQQVVYEVGGRQDTDDTNNAAIGTGLRYQRALDQHWLVVIDTFVTKREKQDVGQGFRVELQAKF